MRYLEIMLSKLVQAFVQNNFCVFVSSVLVMIVLDIKLCIVYYQYELHAIYAI